MKKAIAAITILAATVSFSSVAMGAGRDIENIIPSFGQTDSEKAYAEAHKKMNQDMAVKRTGNADIDFARSMIPHHQGAVDMARVELKYGKNPELRKMAQNIITQQEREIRRLRAWLAKNDKRR